MRPHVASQEQTDIDESTDTYDTIDWLIKNVRTITASRPVRQSPYPGFYSSAGMINAHPH